MIATDLQEAQGSETLPWPGSARLHSPYKPSIEQTRHLSDAQNPITVNYYLLDFYLFRFHTQPKLLQLVYEQIPIYQIYCWRTISGRFSRCVLCEVACCD